MTRLRPAGLRLLVAALAALFGTHAGAADPGDDWRLRAPADLPVVYQGAVNLDGAGTGGGAMLYPAPNLAGLVAAVITHGLLSESTRNAEKTRLQEAADQALKPFREHLASFRYPQLLQLALERMDGSRAGALARPDDPPVGWRITSAPVFLMTQDQQALIVDNAVAMYPPGETERAAYSATIRVVSRPRANPQTEWSEQARAGSALREESAQMVAHSLTLALRDAARPPPAEGGFRTLRFAEGGKERIERSQPVETLCERVVVRTLRGWLLSVPAPVESAGCDAAPTGWR